MKKVSDKRKSSTPLGFNSTFGRKVYTAEQAKELLKAKASTPGKSERRKWMDLADKYFSEWIRLRDSGPDGRGKCVTCSHTDHWRYQQNGHLVTRGHMSTRFDEQNCSLQCRGCNYNGGQHVKHATAIDARYGPGTSEALHIKAKRRCKRTAADLKFIAESYKSKVMLIKENEPERYNAK